MHTGYKISLGISSGKCQLDLDAQSSLAPRLFKEVGLTVKDKGESLGGTKIPKHR